MPQSTPAFLFTSAVLVGFAFWFFGLVEAIGMWRFWPWAYRAGPRVFAKELPRRTTEALADTNLSSPDVKAVAVDAQLVLFRTPMPLLGFRIHTPFPVLGSALLQSGTVVVTGRIPIGPTGFLATWLFGWTIGGSLAFAQKPLLGIGFAAMGWLFVGGMVVFSLQLELGRFRRALDALGTRIGVAT